MKNDDNTETRIKEAAKKLFQEKGFSATRTREIAESAGINSALLNYYFRSKEKLFHIIMLDSLRDMFSFMGTIINDETTSLGYKIDVVVNKYIDICKDSPNLPLFIMNQLSVDAGKMIQESGIPPNLISGSYVYKQLQEHLIKQDIHFPAMHILINLISMSIMPAISRPLISYLYISDKASISEFMEERRRLIPIWIKTIIKLED
ncbi:MAG: helix-turn-helix domain-containing protein [Dysgonomonas sp.]|nr:helix-turn-helix domain-containing protein [Dysgonomonas sp.]